MCTYYCSYKACNIPTSLKICYILITWINMLCWTIYNVSSYIVFLTFTIFITIFSVLFSTVFIYRFLPCSFNLCYSYQFTIFTIILYAIPTGFNIKIGYLKMLSGTCKKNTDHTYSCLRGWRCSTSWGPNSGHPRNITALYRIEGLKGDLRPR